MKKILFLLAAVVLTFSMSVAQNSEVAESLLDSSCHQAVSSAAVTPAIHLSSSSNFGEDVLIPLVAISSPFVCAVLIVFFVLYYRNREKKLRYEVMTKAIESGLELPADFFEASKKNRSQKQPQKGIVLLAVGVGLFGMTYLWPDVKELWPISILPICIGVGQIVAWKLEQRMEKKGENRDENRPQE